MNKYLNCKTDITFNTEDLTSVQVNSIILDFVDYYKAQSSNGFNRNVKVERDATSVTFTGLTTLSQKLCENEGLEFNNEYKRVLFNQFDTEKFAEIYSNNM